MDTDSQNEGRASLEEIATNLGVEEEFVGDEKSCQKSMPNLHRKFTGAVGFETSALAKRAVLPEPARQGLHQHIYI